ncbi:MAG: hypothetical protein HRF45_08055 [Fimbriimonadia bacterium]|jgi:hypothetical protein
MEGLKIVGVCVLASVVYGLVQDQITSRICIEYFTVFHPPVIVSDSPTLVGLVWGVIATWWVGVLLGAPLVMVSRLGSRPELNAADLVRPIAWLMVAVAIGALVAGVAGYIASKNGWAWPPEWVATQLPVEKHAAFMADWWAHQMAYDVGFLGGIALWVYAWLRRRKLALELTSKAADRSHRW